MYKNYWSPSVKVNTANTVKLTARLRAKATMSLEDSKRFHEQIRINKNNAMLGRLNNS